MVKNYLFIVFCFVLFFSSCREKGRTEQKIISERIANSIFQGDGSLGDSVYFAEGFHIESHAAYTRVKVRNPWDTEQTLQAYVLVPKSAELPETLPEGVLIRTPLERTVCYGSVQCGFFSEFGALPTIAGVCEPQYINIPFIQDGIGSGQIVDLGQSAHPNIEKIMLIEPEALFTSPIEGYGYGQAAGLGIPLVECVDYMEATPLGRAEWIRFLALFFDKRALADSLFRETAKRYYELQQLAGQVDVRPTVLAEKMYSGIWYVPGGHSYVAHLFRNAGAENLWKDDKHTGSIGLSFETVVEKAEKADFWLIKYNSSYEMTYEGLVEDYPNYALFEAYKQKKIYICNTGKTPYYEELPIHPDYVLKDMIWIFHPELLPDYHPKYYKKMEN